MKIDFPRQIFDKCRNTQFDASPHC